MPNLNENKTWEEGVYQLELTDRVEGGVGGTSNIQANQLANRTAYLKDKVDTLLGDVSVLTSRLDAHPGSVSYAITENGAAASPNFYSESNRFTAINKGASIVTPKEVWVNINNKGIIIGSSATLAVDNAGSWDSKATIRESNKAYQVGDFVTGDTTGNPTEYIYRCITAGQTSSLTPSLPTAVAAQYLDGNVMWEAEKNPAYAANRAGKDYYIYVVLDSSNTPSYILSDRADFPVNYDTTNSRKVGGFHCLCLDVGTIADHALSDYATGAVLPDSIYSNTHRPISEPEGMVYVEGLDLWVDIYLNTWTGSTANKTLKMVSKFGGVTADGTSAEVMHPNKWKQTLGEQKKRLPWQREFFIFSLGSNQATFISGAKDWDTAGGHVDTANRRMISDYGIEDCCGFLWQWGSDIGSSSSGSWSQNWTAADRSDVKGGNYTSNICVLLGGDWGSGDSCGSRCAYWGLGALDVRARSGARAVAEPLNRSI